MIALFSQTESRIVHCNNYSGHLTGNVRAITLVFGLERLNTETTTTTTTTARTKVINYRLQVSDDKGLLATVILWSVCIQC